MQKKQVASHTVVRTTTGEAEELLWQFLRHGQIEQQHFLRREWMEGFPLTFYCPQARLAIRLWGDDQFSSAAIALDSCCAVLLRRAGIVLLSVSAEEVLLRCGEVLEEIRRTLQERRQPDYSPVASAVRVVSSS